MIIAEFVEIFGGISVRNRNKIRVIRLFNFLDVIYTDELSDKNLEDKKIDALYIGIAQRFFNYDIEKLSVKI